MRVLVLTKRHYTNRDLLRDRYGRLYHLPAQLANLGHEILVFAADYELGPEATESTGRLSITSKPSSSLRIGSFGRAAMRAAVSFEPDLVVASADTPYGVIGRWISKKLAVPFVFDVYDDYRTFASGRIPGAKAVFGSVTRSADLVICSSEPLRALLEPLNLSTIVITNGVDRSLFYPRDQKASRRQLDLEDSSQIVGYFGSIAPARGVDVLIEAVRELRREGRPVNLLLAGSLSIQIDLALPWIEYRGLVPQDQIPTLISSTDVVGIPYLNDPQVDVSNAAKLPEYLACGAATVTTRVSDYSDAFGLPEAATCEPGDVVGLAKAIASQLDNPQYVPLPDGYEWETLGRKLETELMQLLIAWQSNDRL